MAKKRLNARRLFATMVMIAGTIVAADCVRRDFFTNNENHIVVTGSFRSADAAVQADNNGATALSNATQPATQPSTGIANLGYSELSVPASQLSSGLLTIVNTDIPTEQSDSSGFVNLIDVKNEFYSLNYEGINLSEDAAEALNSMMCDYNAATGLADFVIFGTTETFTGDGSRCPRYFPESKTGNTIDLAIKGYDGTLLSYDGLDAEAWVIENCAKYGFVVRYPQGKEITTGQQACVWHLRYVGEVHAAVMAEKGLCLEEYVSLLKTYSVDMPLIFPLNGVQYEIYYTASMGDVTPVRVPVSGNYTISGNNQDGFIVTAVK